jgi:hypothetical protein
MPSLQAGRRSQRFANSVRLGAHFDFMMDLSHRPPPVKGKCGCNTALLNRFSQLAFLIGAERRTKATLIYRRTGNLGAVQLLLGYAKIKSTVCYLLASRSTTRLP